MPRRKSRQIAVEEPVDSFPQLDEKTEIANLRTALEKIKSREGIIGYIVRDPTSAWVDIKDPSKIIDYAALSAEILESSETISDMLGLGKISNIVLEGKTLKVLSWSKGEQRLSIFMEKNVDHNAIFKEIT